jgi:streptogramin lyase
MPSEEVGRMSRPDPAVRARALSAHALLGCAIFSALALCTVALVALGVVANPALAEVYTGELALKAHPGSLALNSEGDVWTSEWYSNRLVELEPSGKEKRSAIESLAKAEHSECADPGALHGPFGVAVDAKGNVWVADSRNNRVLELTAEGKCEREVGDKEGKESDGYNQVGSGAGDFSYPTGVAIGPSGNVWVVDDGNNRVEEFSETGTYIGAFGSFGKGECSLDIPFGIAVDAHGHIWVSEPYAYRVQRFQETGKAVAAECVAGASLGAGFPEGGVAVDPQGNVWIPEEGKVKKYNASGELLTTFGLPGTGTGELSGVEGIAVNTAGDAWLSMDVPNRLEEWSPSSEPLVPEDAASPALDMNFFPGDPSESEIGTLWTEAKEAGASVVRVETGESHNEKQETLDYELEVLAKAAYERGMKLDWLLVNCSSTEINKECSKEGNGPEDAPPNSIAKYISAYDSLTPEHLKSAVIAFEYGNENWTGPEGSGVHLTGNEYGDKYVAAGAEQVAEHFGVPLLMQVRLSPGEASGGAAWMNSLFEGKSKDEALREALIGNGGATSPENWLASHPYGASMMLPPALGEQTNLENDRDSLGDEWGSERWLKEAYFVTKKTGLDVPVAITEYGCGIESEEHGMSIPVTVNACKRLEEHGNPSALVERTEMAEHFWEFSKLVKEKAVPKTSLPAEGFVPKLAFATWYDEYGSAENFGVWRYASGHSPPGVKESDGEFFEQFSAGAKSLATAP